MLSLQDSEQSNKSPFDSIRLFDEQGNEFWRGRQLMSRIGYAKWQRFGAKDTDQISVIEKAIISCKNAKALPENHFTHLPKQVSGSGTQGEDWKLSRYACYLIAMNGDPTKPEIAMAQSYFAIKTREAEVVVPAQNDRIKELELQNEHLRLQVQANQSALALGQFRHLVTTTCPEPIQQKVLGYQVVEKIEYRDRIYHEQQLINEGDTLTKADLCYRYGILTKNKKPDYKRLNIYFDELGITSRSDMWKLSVAFQENLQFRRDSLEELDKVMMSAERQTYLGENTLW
jgi:hypothetical protein